MVSAVFLRVKGQSVHVLRDGSLPTADNECAVLKMGCSTRRPRSALAPQVKFAVSERQ